MKCPICNRNVTKYSEYQFGIGTVFKSYCENNHYYKCDTQVKQLSEVFDLFINNKIEHIEINHKDNLIVVNCNNNFDLNKLLYNKFNTDIYDINLLKTIIIYHNKFFCI